MLCLQIETVWWLLIWFFFWKILIIFIAPAGDLYMKSFIEFAKTRSQNVNHSFRILKMFYRSFFMYWLVCLCLWDLLLLLYVYLRMNAYCLHTSHQPHGSPWFPFEGSAATGGYLLIVITPYISCILYNPSFISSFFSVCCFAAFLSLSCSLLVVVVCPFLVSLSVFVFVPF